MSNIIQKKRKVVNGVNITLLEKSVKVEPVVDTDLLYKNFEIKLRQYVDGQFSEIYAPIVVNKDIQTSSIDQQIPTSTIFTLSKDDILGVISNSPEEGSILSYTDDNISWRQSPNVRFDLIDNELNNYKLEFKSDHIYTNKLHIPFAVTAYTDGTVWGGNGRAGIFWLDPWDQPVDNYSIKMGLNNPEIGESGYSFGTVNELAMKFTNGSEGGRGFVWCSSVPPYHGYMQPVMSLDTDDPISNNGGNLTVARDITSNLGKIVISGNDSSTPIVGNIVIPNFTPTNPIISTIGASDSYNNYVLTYETVAGSLGKISLKPPTGGGGGGGSFPGVQMDGGSFLQEDQYARIDAGSFI